MRFTLDFHVVLSRTHFKATKYDSDLSCVTTRKGLALLAWRSHPILSATILFHHYFRHMSNVSNHNLFVTIIVKNISNHNLFVTIIVNNIPFTNRFNVKIGFHRWIFPFTCGHLYSIYICICYTTPTLIFFTGFPDNIIFDHLRIANTTRKD